MQATTTAADQAIFHWFPLYFIALWSFVSCVLSMVGGWWGLTQNFRSEERFSGRWIRCWAGCSMRFGVSYGGFVVKFGADDGGLRIAISPLFRIGHPPLHLPWGEVSAEKSPRWVLLQNVTLRLGKDARIPLRMSKGCASRLPQLRAQLQEVFSEEENRKSSQI